MSTPSLKGKTIFITGASRGIGRAIALRYESREFNQKDFESLQGGQPQHHTDIEEAHYTFNEARVK